LNHFQQLSEYTNIHNKLNQGSLTNSLNSSNLTHSYFVPRVSMPFFIFSNNFSSFEIKVGSYLGPTYYVTK